MRRFVGLLFFILFAFPIGLSVAGCSKTAAVVYCNGSGFGPTAGQVKSITLASNLTTTGESLYYGQIGPPLTATSEDCNGAAVSVTNYTYATTDHTIADINPTNGTVCGGTWNRSTGGGVSDYTICTPALNPTAHTALITASANGASSNAIEVFVHPAVTSVQLGGASVDCTNDPASNCASCNPNLIGSTQQLPPAYSASSCISQNTTAELVARVYAGNTNITCQVGPVAFALQNDTAVATVNAQGVITANQPGSALVTATVSNSSSALNAGFVSTCPPTSITLSPVGQTANGGNINVAINSPQTFTVVATDKNNVVLESLALEFNSTLPVNFPTSSSSVTAAYPGSATITAVCQPPTCNPSPFSQIGYLGNGVPITSNGLTLTAPGTSSDVLYMGSLNSQYIVSKDFTTSVQASPVKLPYTPTSMVISQDGTTIYMGSAGGLMTLTTSSGAVASTFQTIQGNVLAVAPNNSYAVMSDPTRGVISLVTPSGTVSSTIGGVGTRAQWTPDSTTLYVTTTNPAGTPGPLLTYSTFVGWESTPVNEQYTDVAVTVPNAGAYFAGLQSTDGRSDCPSTVVNPTSLPPTTSNTFSPLADTAAVPTDRLTFTNNGQHLLGATVQSAPTLQDIVVTLPRVVVNGISTIAPCPFQSTVNVGFFSDTHTSHPLAGISATAINQVVSSGNSNVAFVTYNTPNGVSSNLLPIYVPSTGTLGNVTLSGGATDPIAGVFSTDNNTFYVGTAGDNVVHTIGITGTSATDTGVITPALPTVTATGTATPNLIVLRARKATA